MKGVFRSLVGVEAVKANQVYAKDKDTIRLIEPCELAKEQSRLQHHTINESAKVVS